MLEVRSCIVHMGGVLSAKAWRMELTKAWSMGLLRVRGEDAASLDIL